MTTKILLAFLIAIQPLLISSSDCQHACQDEETCISFQYKNTCYYAYTDKTRTWQESSDFCRHQQMSSVKMTLENINNGFTVKEITIRLGQHAFLWLGGMAEDLQKPMFVNGVPLSKPHELSLKNDGSEFPLCGIIWNDSSIDKDNCQNTHNFICRYDDWQDIPSFYISEIPADWFQARSRCKELGGDLFYLKEQENIQFLQTKLSCARDKKFFIGLTSRRWYWDDGTEIVHYNWQSQEPNQPGKKCLAMNPDSGTWIDTDCSTTVYAFCQQVSRYSLTSTISTLESNVKRNPHSNQAGVAVLCLLLAIAVATIIGLMYRFRLKGPNKRTTDDVENKEQEIEPFMKSSVPIPIPHANREANDLEAEATSRATKQITPPRPPQDAPISRQMLRKVTRKDLEGGWPYPVTLIDDGPDFKAILSLPQLHRLSHHDLSKIDNVTLVYEDVFNPGEVCAVFELDNLGTKILKYETKLPDDIVPSLSSVKIETKCITLSMRKKRYDENVSWIEERE